MWVDDRYVDITQKGTNEAKARLAERKTDMSKNEPQAALHDDHGHEHSHNAYHYDWKKISVDQGTPFTHDSEVSQTK
jgi:hypothetical protein